MIKPEKIFLASNSKTTSKTPSKLCSLQGSHHSEKSNLLVIYLNIQTKHY